MKVNHLKHICGGTWQPVQGWSGRYRCSHCSVYGYRYASAPKAYKHVDKPAPENIVQYICNTKGCKNGAIQKIRYKGWKCRSCLNEHTAVSRRGQ